jgi:hypothetical protein
MTVSELMVSFLFLINFNYLIIDLYDVYLYLLYQKTQYLMKNLIFGGLIVLLASCGGGATSNEVPATDNATDSATTTVVVDSTATNNVDTLKTK